MSTGYFEESYPPSILPYAKGATAGIPGTFTPPGSIVPISPVALAQGYPVTVIASPATPWTAGQYVQTGTEGAAGRASWTGTNWVSGAAPSGEPSQAVFEAIPVEETPEGLVEE